MISLFTFKRLVLFIVVSLIIFVNLAISVARFTSYTNFMGDFKLKVYATSITKDASKVTVGIKLVGDSGVLAKNAYFSQAALAFSIGNKTLGVLQIPTTGMIGEFDGRTFVATSYFVFTGNEAVAFEKFPSEPLNYQIYLITHFLTGTHDTRGTMFFKGEIKQVGL
uniref:Uncharacterized protein n=1 Tax=Mesoaciditoga lauensis TaxID=1495039 RepID=A0A7V3RDB9_9BACT